MKVEIKYTPNTNIPAWLIQALNGNELMAGILANRGIDTPEKLKVFLEPEHYQPTDPFAFPNMEKAVELLLKAVEEGKHFCVYGDYDVDGVTSTTILVTMLQSLGANVRYHLPNRFTEGYGMNARIVKQLAGEVDFILTCDCGISNHTEVALAKSLGMTVVVTDHHHLPETLPAADAIVTPKLLPDDHPAHHLPGAGMAYYLALALLARLGRVEEGEGLLDLVAMAIVADVVPVLDENRYLLWKGLPALANTQRPGLVELFQQCGLTPMEMTEETIAFQLAPRLNAAGRIASAQLAVELLLTTDAMEAKTLARQLDQVNTRRKEMSEAIQEEALRLLENEPSGHPIILYQPHWHEGILGIAASKLCEDHHVPVLLMSLKEDGKTITGSARSIAGLHIYEALQQCEPFLLKFGGHAGAAGFSLHRDKVTVFQKSMDKILSDELLRLGQVKTIRVDGQLPLTQITPRLYHDLQRLAPFGEANPLPLFLCNDVEVIYHRPTTDEKHLRLIVKQEEVQHPAIWWWSGKTRIARKVDLVYSIGLNRWRDKEELQLILAHAADKALPPSAEPIMAMLAMPIFEIEDRRNWRELGQSMIEESAAVYFDEGVGPSEFAHAVDRYDFVTADTLVLLSCPPGMRVLYELVFTIRPKKVVLAYSATILHPAEVFLKQLLLVLKEVITEDQGRCDIYQLAAAVGEMENTVSVGLRFLTAKGLIELESGALGDFTIRKGDHRVRKELAQTEAKLRELLEESRAFRKYLMKATTQQIHELITAYAMQTCDAERPLMTEKAGESIQRFQSIR